MEKNSEIKKLRKRLTLDLICKIGLSKQEERMKIFKKQLFFQHQSKSMNNFQNLQTSDFTRK